MNDFKIALDSVYNLQFFLHNADMKKFNHALEIITDLKNKYEPLISHKFNFTEIIVLSGEDTPLNVKNKIESSYTKYITLDIGTYTDDIDGLYLKKVKKLIMRNNQERFSRVPLRNMTSLRTIDIIWDLKQQSKRYLFDTDGFKEKVDINLKFINTTDLIPGKSTLTYDDDIAELQNLGDIGTEETKKRLWSDSYVLGTLGKNITKLDARWFWMNHPGADDSATQARYFLNLTWLDLGWLDDLDGKDLIKLRNLETLGVSGSNLRFGLNNLENEISQLPHLKILKYSLHDEMELCEYLPPIDFIRECKTLTMLYLPDPANWFEKDNCDEYESKLMLECPDVRVIYYKQPFQG